MLAQIVTAIIVMAEITPIATTAPAEKASLLLWLDLHSWEQAMIWSLGFAALAAVAVVVSTACVVVLTRDETARATRELESYKLTVEEKVSGARAEGIAAGEKAGNALVRAAELEKEAAIAKLETERLKASVSWRQIAPEVAGALESILSKRPGSVNLRYTDGDPEALYLAIQIANVLAKAKWQIAPGASKIGNSITFGFALPDNNSDDAKVLREAFAHAKIQFSTELPQSGSAVEFNVSRIPGAPTLMVGSRTPPQFP